MAKLTRAAQKQFGSSAGFQQMAKYGSFAAGVPARFTGATITPALVQQLSNYLDGWFGAVVGGNSPAIEDMNALCWLFAYQLGYILQTGIPEWNSETIYFIGSYAQDGAGAMYISKTDNNLNNALSNNTHWQLSGGGMRTMSAVGNILATDGIVLLDATAGAFIATLPPCAATPVGKQIIVKNISTNGNIATLKGNAAELIDLANTLGLDSNPVLESYTVRNTGTKWLIF